MRHLVTGLTRRFVPLLCVGMLFAAASTRAQVDSTIAFVDVNVVPMDSERVLTRHTVVVQGDRIISIDPADEAVLPRGTRRIEALGKYLIPGLIDAHGRLLSDDYIDPGSVELELAVAVANGVTTMRHARGDPRLLRLRDRVAAEDVPFPALYVSSPEIASIPGAYGFNGRFVQSPFEGASAVRQFREAGYDFVTMAAANAADVYEGVMLTARGSRMPLIGRIPAAVTLQRALDAGQQIEFLDGYTEALAAAEPVPADGPSGSGLWQPDRWRLLGDVDDGRLEDVAQATVDAEVWNIPMLAALRAALGLAPEEERGGAAAERFISPTVRAALRRAGQEREAQLPQPQLRRRYAELRDQIVRQIDRAGGKLMAGSGDPPWSAPYGFGLYDELAALAAAGMAPWAVLRAATAGPAEFLSFRGGGRAEYATVDEGGIRFTPTTNVDVDFGRIDVGLRADLVLLSDNPLDDVANVRLVEGVMLRGRWLPRDELDALLARSAEVLGAAPLRSDY
jgi:imidazolonepropionase-like amidohydrolase